MTNGEKRTESSKVVSEVLGQRRFRLRDSPKRSLSKTIDKFFRHPATLLILGFILTAIVGGWIQNRQHEVEAARLEREQSLSAVYRIQEANSEFLHRAEVIVTRLELQASLGTGDPELHTYWLDADDALMNVKSQLIAQDYLIEKSFPEDGIPKAALHFQIGVLSNSIRIQLNLLNKRLWQAVQDQTKAKELLPEVRKLQEGLAQYGNCTSAFFYAIQQRLSDDTPRLDRYSVLLTDFDNEKERCPVWGHSWGIKLKPGEQPSPW